MHFLEGYTPLMKIKIVKWMWPSRGKFKCNIDGDVRDRIESLTFCIRNEDGEMIYAETKLMENISAIKVELKAIRIGMDYCLSNHLVPLIVETDYLMAQKVLNGIWKSPWLIALD